MIRRIAFAQLITVALFALGCEEKKEAQASDESQAEAQNAAAVASAKAALEAAQKAAANKAEAPPEPKGPPVLKATDLETTDERRAKIENAIPDASHFILASDIERRLHAQELDDEAKALRAFDKLAKDKWVLITGNVANKTEDGLDLAVTYTPQAPNDPMGMSKKFFFVTISGVEGFDPEAYKEGQFAVILMKYDGQKKASAGHDVVAKGLWM